MYVCFESRAMRVLDWKALETMVRRAERVRMDEKKFIE